MKHLNSDSGKMSRLKTLHSGQAKSKISVMGYSGRFYSVAWSILEQSFGKPHAIIDAQLESLRKASQVKPHNSASLILIQFSIIVSDCTLRTCSKSGKKLFISNQMHPCIWQLISYHRCSKRSSSSLLTTRTRNCLIQSCLKNGLREWHSGMKGSQGLQVRA